MIIKPNPGAQEKFLSSNADIVIYGGGRGGGKTWALLLEVIRHCKNPKFTAVIFRRTYPQIEASGGLWDKSCELFPLMGAIANISNFKWTFPSGATCRFRHLKDDADLMNVQGAEICYIGLDELTHFTLKMFTTLLGANRSTCGIKPFMRATCNPDASSWVAAAVEPWLKPDGFANVEIGGVEKYFEIENEELIWRSPNEGREMMSLTFIPALVWDNPRLLEKDPQYVQRLRTMQLVERERFLGGNWRIKAESGTVFRRDWFKAERINEHGDRSIRYWDIAATTMSNAKAGDFTVGLLLSHDAKLDRYIILDVIRVRHPPAYTNQLILETAQADGRNVPIRWQQDPAAAGVRDSVNLQSMLRGFDARGEIEMRDKVSRALPVSYMAEQGKIILAIAGWNHAFLSEAENFPDKCKHDDQVDSLSGAFNSLTKVRGSNKKVIY
jgi:predicted phage terminase large subunit-like protein